LICVGPPKGARGNHASDAFIFSHAAGYFEFLVKRERDESRQAELGAAARFYRELAEIIPSFPRGYTERWDTWDTTSRLDSRAEECKSIAAVLRDPECRAELLRLAQTYQ
jgi:hypothetical protein